MLSQTLISTTATSLFLTKPKVYRTRWSWKEFAINAFQFSDGTYGLTLRQMAAKVRQTKESAKKFVEEAGLPYIKGEFNKDFDAIICPLDVAASYWKHIDETSGSSVARAGWKAIEEYFAFKDNAETTNQLQLADKVYNLSILPKPKPELQVLIIGERESEEYRISMAGALTLIGISPDWLEKVRAKADRTRAELIKKGFCGQTREYGIQDGSQIKTVSTIGVLDCLAVWEYFSYKGCTPAISALKALAIETLEQRIEKMRYAEKVSG